MPSGSCVSLRQVTTSTNWKLSFQWHSTVVRAGDEYARDHPSMAHTADRIRVPWSSFFCLLHVSLGYLLPMPFLFFAVSKDLTPQLSSFRSAYTPSFLVFPWIISCSDLSFVHYTFSSYNHPGLFYTSPSTSYNLASILTSLLEKSFSWLSPWPNTSTGIYAPWAFTSVIGIMFFFLNNASPFKVPSKSLFMRFCVFLHLIYQKVKLKEVRVL